jgi:hypothetical protein
MGRLFDPGMIGAELPLRKLDHTIQASSARGGKQYGLENSTVYNV